MAKRFKKGSIEAKRFMAKIRLKKSKPKATKKSLGADNKKDKPLSYYKYSTPVVKMAFNGVIQQGGFYSAEDCLNAIKKQAQTKEELSHYSIVTPDKVIHLGKEYKIRYSGVGALAPINKSEQTLSFVPKTITENQILKEINKVKEEILHLLNMQKEHILKGHKRSLGALVKNKQKEIGNLLKKCK